MLRLRRGVLAQLPSSPFASPLSHLHRLLSAAAPAISPNPSFAVENYLVATCGLSRAQAIKASTKLSHLRSPANPDAVLAFFAGLGLSGADVAALVATCGLSRAQAIKASTKLSHLRSPANPDAVLAFLAGLGLSGADVAALVARDPQFLCASVERTLGPVVAGLSGLGLSRSDIACLAPPAVRKFRQKSVVSKLQYYLRLLGTSHNFLRVMKSCNVLSYNLERVVKPNLALLQRCGLGDCDIAKLCISTPRLLTNNPKRVQAIVTCAQNIGVPRGSRMFRHALHAVAYFREEIAARVEYLRNTFRWTDAEVGMAVSKAPMVLTRAKESLQRTSEFLISEVGLEPAYIARRPTLLTFSLKGRLRARHYVVKFLKENGLLGRNRDYYYVVNITEKEFVEKFICPHKEAAPHLAKDYAAACKDEVPTRFRFT